MILKNISENLRKKIDYLNILRCLKYLYEQQNKKINTKKEEGKKQWYHKT